MTPAPKPLDADRLAADILRHLRDDGFIVPGQDAITLDVLARLTLKPLIEQAVGGHIESVELQHAEVVAAATALADWCEINNQAIDRRAILNHRLDVLARCRASGDLAPLRVFMDRCRELEAYVSALERQLEAAAHAREEERGRVAELVAVLMAIQNLSRHSSHRHLAEVCKLATAALAPTETNDAE